MFEDVQDLMSNIETNFRNRSAMQTIHLIDLHSHGIRLNFGSKLSSLKSLALVM